jgi:AcrR family transcriptional regulator
VNATSDAAGSGSAPLPESAKPAEVAEQAMSAEAEGVPAGSTYRRSAGSARGEARKAALLEAVTDDLAAEGLVDYSLRRAARAAGTTHKVLLYYFDSAEDLLRQAIVRLRQRRIDSAVATVAASPPAWSLGERMRAVWPVLREDVTGLRALDQMIGLAMYDPVRYADIGREASEQYRPALRAMCPADWPDWRKHQVSELIMAVFRGFLIEWVTTRDDRHVEAGLEALVRALDREEAAPAAG